jgi:hypothetical protein
MKALFITCRILFFVSFFLPFVLIPRCGPSADELAKKAKFMQDSIRTADSLNQSEIALINDSSSTAVQNDSMAKAPDTIKTQVAEAPEKGISDYLTDFYDFLKQPTKDAFSGYSLSLIAIGGIEFSVVALIFKLFSLSFTFSVVGLLLLFFNRKHIMQFIVSLVSFVSFAVFAIYLLLTDNVIPVDNILWGFWVSLILSAVNVAVAFVVRYRHRTG